MIEATYQTLGALAQP